MGRRPPSSLPFCRNRANWIGRNCLVGAGALVTEGKEFADNSLIVGAPARVIRTIGEAEAAQIARGADIYVKRWQRYAAGLRRVG